MSLVGFNHLLMEDSFLLGIFAEGDDLILKVEFALSQQHPLYRDPLPNEARCWRRGEVRFQGIEVVSQEGGGPFLGSGPKGGDIDLGSIGIYAREGFYEVDLDMGRFTCRAESVSAKF
jgi:hypothetical protein